MKINLVTDLDIHDFSGAGISGYASGMTNCVTHKNGGKIRVTQRPSIDITEDSTSLGLNNRARGIFYWEYNDTLYIVHDNDVYADTQDSTPLTTTAGTFSAGSEAVSFAEAVGTPKLAIIDSENNKLWLVNDAAPDTLTPVTTNVPTAIVYGSPVLDGYLFLMDEGGIIYNSDVDDFATFGALSYKEAERENDKGVYLGKHHDNIVAFGTRTIEFFYDNRNPVGSPLNRRQDIAYNIGCADGLAVWENGDVTYFLGSTPAGEIAIYKLENFVPTIISNENLNSYFTQLRTQSGYRIRFSGMGHQGRDVLIVTVYHLNESSNIVIDQTISYYSGIWGFISTLVNSHTKFPLMSWTKRTGGQSGTDPARTGEGLFYNGDVVALNDKLVPIDTALGGYGVYEDGVYETGVYASAASDVGTAIPFKIRTGLVDGETPGYKFQSRGYLMCENTDSTQTMTIKHSDEVIDDFDAGRTINLSLTRKEVYQGGRFMKRNYELSGNSSEQIFIESFGIDVEVEG